MVLWHSETIKNTKRNAALIKCQKQITKKNRGTFEAAEVVQDNSGAIYVKWYDNKVINMISTFAKTHPLTMTLFDSKSKKHNVLIL